MVIGQNEHLQRHDGRDKDLHIDELQEEARKVSLTFFGFHGVGVIGCLTDFPSEPKQVQSAKYQHRHHDPRDQLIEFCAEKST